jgi:TadE-like protein
VTHLLNATRRRAHQAGQALVEFTLIISVVLLLLLGMVEFGFIFDHHLTIEYASREGARVGAALANGGGPMGCSTGQSPNAATVDQQIVAAVQRVITSPGSAVVASSISEIRIYRSDAAGNQTGSQANVYVYNLGGGPVVDGAALNFAQSGSTGWAACSRDNGGTPDSIGVSLKYRYTMVTPLGAVLGFFGPGGATGVDISDRTVMALNPGS